jgi:copper homeostasis protein
MEYTLEVCVDSIESALSAAQAGADRLELACCLDQGGVTPSYGFISQVCRRINSCKVHVLIRPRVGDFLYSEDEIDVITADVIQIAGLGADGVVIGFLEENGKIDMRLTTRFVELCAALSEICSLIYLLDHNIFVSAAAATPLQS